MEEKILTVGEVLCWLQLSIGHLELLRRGRDATKFPPPLLGKHGLSFYEQDIVDWLAFIADWQDAGMTREALEVIPAPTYKSVEPELRTCARRGSEDAR